MNIYQIIFFWLFLNYSKCLELIWVAWRTRLEAIGQLTCQWAWRPKKVGRIEWSVKSTNRWSSRRPKSKGAVISRGSKSLMKSLRSPRFSWWHKWVRLVRSYRLRRRRFSDQALQINLGLNRCHHTGMTRSAPCSKPWKLRRLPLGWETRSPVLWAKALLSMGVHNHYLNPLPLAPMASSEGLETR